MALPAQAPAEPTVITFPPDQLAFRAILAWRDEFYADPANRAAYAAWCEANGLKNDLPEGEEI